MAQPAYVQSPQAPVRPSLHSAIKGADGSGSVFVVLPNGLTVTVSGAAPGAVHHIIVTPIG